MSNFTARKETARMALKAQRDTKCPHKHTKPASEWAVNKAKLIANIQNVIDQS